MSDWFGEQAEVEFAPAEQAVTKAQVAQARTVLQRRLEDGLDAQARVKASGDNLRVQLRDPAQIPLVVDLATVLGQVVFFASAEYVAPGSPVPAGVEIILTNFDLAAAQTAYSAITGEYGLVAFQLTPSGTRKLATYSQAAVGEFLVVALDGSVLTSPQISAPILDGRGVVSTEMNEAGAKRLAAIFNSGPLPYPLGRVEP